MIPIFLASSTRSHKSRVLCVSLLIAYLVFITAYLPYIALTHQSHQFSGTILAQVLKISTGFKVVQGMTVASFLPPIADIVFDLLLKSEHQIDLEKILLLGYCIYGNILYLMFHTKDFMPMLFLIEVATTAISTVALCLSYIHHNCPNKFDTVLLIITIGILSTGHIARVYSYAHWSKDVHKMGAARVAQAGSFAFAVFCIYWLLRLWYKVQKRGGFTNYYISTGEFTSAVYLVCFGLLAILAIAQRLAIVENLTESSLIGLIALKCVMVLPVVISPEQHAMVTRLRSTHTLLRLKKMFVRYVSHEIRSPLNVVHAGLDLLKGDILSSNPEGNIIELIEDMFNSSEIANSVLNDLLHYENLEAGDVRLDLETKTVRGFLKGRLNSLSHYAGKHNIEFIIEDEIGATRSDEPLEMKFASNIDTVCQILILQVDVFRLDQVIRNLVSNAIKFTTEGGKVVLRLSHVLTSTYAYAPTSTLAASPPSSSSSHMTSAINESLGFLRIEVKDTGMGIALEDQAKLFAQFAQINAFESQAGAGSGLGLWISRKIVDLHGGGMGFYSDGAGKGTTFVVDIPLYSITLGSDAYDAETAELAISLVRLPSPRPSPRNMTTAAEAVGSLSDPERELTSHRFLFLTVVFTAGAILFLPVAVGTGDTLASTPEQVIRSSDIKVAFLAVIGTAFTKLFVIVFFKDFGLMDVVFVYFVFILQMSIGISLVVFENWARLAILFITLLFYAEFTSLVAVCATISRLCPRSIHPCILIVCPLVRFISMILRLWSFALPSSSSDMWTSLVLAAAVFWYLSVGFASLLVIAWMHFIWGRTWASGRFDTSVLTTAEYTCSMHILAIVFFMMMFILLSLCTNTFTFETFNGNYFIGFGMMNCFLMVPLLVLPGRLARRRALLAASNTLQQKRLFVRYVSHEVRSPLNVVHGGVDLLKLTLTTSAASDEVMELIEDIIDSTDAAIAILNDLLKFEAMDAGKFELCKSLVSVSILLWKVTPPLLRVAKKNGVFFSTENVTDELRVLGLRIDIVRMAEAVECFATNAIKMTPRGGTVTLRVIPQVESSASLNSSTEATLSLGFVHVVVESTGAGLAMCYEVSKVFGDFNPENLSGGAGTNVLGTWVSKRIIEMHDGTASFSRDDVSCISTVHMLLPVAEYLKSDEVGSHSWAVPVEVPRRRSVLETLTSFPSPLFHSPVKRSNSAPLYVQDPLDEQDAKMSGENVVGDSTVKMAESSSSAVEIKRFLIVDDSSTNRKIVRRLIESLFEVTKHFEVLEANDGTEGVDIVEQSMRPGGLRVHVVLMDNIMLGMHGPEAAKLMRKKLGFKGRIIGVTGATLPEDIEHFVQCGADLVLEKPLKRSMLIDALGDTGAQSSPLRTQSPKLSPFSTSPSALKDGGGSRSLNDQEVERGPSLKGWNDGSPGAVTRDYSPRSGSNDGGLSLWESQLSPQRRNKPSVSVASTGRSGSVHVAIATDSTEVVTASDSKTNAAVESSLTSPSASAAAAVNITEPATSTRSGTSSSISGTVRFLVVDKSAASRKVLKRLIQSECKAGPTAVEIIEANDGLAAVEAMGRCPAEEGGSEHWFDYVLMGDSFVSMHGPEAARIMRQELGYKGRIVGVTSSASPEEIAAFIASGAEEVVVKPIKRATFATILMPGHRGEFGSCNNPRAISESQILSSPIMVPAASTSTTAQSRLSGQETECAMGGGAETVPADVTVRHALVSPRMKEEHAEPPASLTSFPGGNCAQGSGRGNACDMNNHNIQDFAAVDVSSDAATDPNHHVMNVDVLVAAVAAVADKTYKLTSNRRVVRFLVVDDSPMSRKMVTRLIDSVCKRLLVEVVEVDDGTTAVETVRRSMVRQEDDEGEGQGGKCSSDRSFNYILIDNTMVQMHGPEAVMIMRQELGYKGRIVGVTGNALPEDVAAFIASGAEEIFIKPLSRAKLLSVLSPAHRSAVGGSFLA